MLVACANGPHDGEIQLVRNGQPVVAAPRKEFKTNVIDLLRSCSVHSTSYAVSTNTWQERMQSDSFVHLHFSSARVLNVMMQTGAPRYRQDHPIDEVLIPLPENGWPDHFFAKSGTNILSFTKYDPIALRTVAFEPALGLSSLEPYKSLAKLPDR